MKGRPAGLRAIRRRWVVWVLSILGCWVAEWVAVELLWLFAGVPWLAAQLVGVAIAALAASRINRCYLRALRRAHERGDCW